MEAAAPARAALVGSASRANVVRNGTAAPAERVAVEETLAELRRAAERALRMPVVQRLLDEEGEEVRSVADIRHEQTLFACAAADEPFLRQRPRRCQVFRCSLGERGGSGGAARWQPDRWHQGKVLPVPERMRELQAAAGAALRLTKVEETAVRFRSVSTGQLIWQTEAIDDDELLVVELDPSDLRAASEEREPSEPRRESGGGTAAAAASWRAPGWGAGRGGARRPRMRPPPRSSYSHSSSSWSSSSVSSALREDLEATGAGYVSSASSSSEEDEEPTTVDMRGRRPS